MGKRNPAGQLIDFCKINIDVRRDRSFCLGTSALLADLRPVIIVFDAHDIVFAQVAAGLDLDQFQIDLAGIFKTVPGPDGDIDQLVLVQDFYVIADRYPGGPAHHNPVLRTVMVHL